MPPGPGPLPAIIGGPAPGPGLPGGPGGPPLSAADLEDARAREEAAKKRAADAAASPAMSAAAALAAAQAYQGDRTPKKAPEQADGLFMRLTASAGTLDAVCEAVDTMSLSSEELASLSGAVATLAAKLAARQTASSIPETGGSCFRLLAGTDELRLVTDLVPAEDALCVALVCRKFRDAVFARFPCPAEKHIANSFSTNDPRFPPGFRSAVAALTAWPGGKAGQKYRPRFAHEPTDSVLSLARFQWAHSLGLISKRWLRVRRPGQGGSYRGGITMVTNATAICEAAARGGHLDVLQEAREKGYDWSAATLGAAAKAGHIHILQYARSTLPTAKRCPWDASVCAQAAAGGQLDALRWCRQRRCPWDHTTCLLAAQAGQLELLQWARKKGCPFGAVFGAGSSGVSEVCYLALEHGHGDTFIWAASHGAEYAMPTAAVLACAFSLISVLDWLHEEHTGDALWLGAENQPGGGDGPDGDERYFLTEMSHSAVNCTKTDHRPDPRRGRPPPDPGFAAKRPDNAGRMAVLEWLHSKGILQLTEVVAEAEAGGDIELFRWVVDKGFVLEQDDLGQLWEAQRGPGPRNDLLDLEVLSTAHKQGLELPPDLLANAVRHNRLPLVIWMRSIGLPWNDPLPPRRDRYHTSASKGTAKPEADSADSADDGANLSASMRWALANGAPPGFAPGSSLPSRGPHYAPLPGSLAGMPYPHGGPAWNGGPPIPPTFNEFPFGAPPFGPPGGPFDHGYDEGDEYDEEEVYSADEDYPYDPELIPPGGFGWNL